MEEQKGSKLIYDVNDKPPIGQWIILALQHVFAMFGATILVPMLVNQGIAAAEVEGEALSIAVALVTAGLGTLIYILCTKAKSPVFLGSSFAFIAPITAAYVAGGLAGAMTGIIVIGLVYIIVSFIVRANGKDCLDKLLPPIVIGPMIMIIGLGLASSAVSNIGLAPGTAQINWRCVLTALITFLVTALVMIKAKGFFKVVPFLIGMVVGYIAAIALGLVDFGIVGEANWFQVPNFNFPFVSYTPDFFVAITMVPIAIVTMAEHIGDHMALSAIIERDLLKEPGLEKTMLGDGIATFVAGILGGPANTTYGENTSVVGMTRNASVWVIGMAACFAIILGFFGKFTAVVQTIPNAVLGGVSLLLYGFIAVNGVKVLIQNKTDFSNNKNIIIASSMLVLGIGGAIINFKISDNMVLPLSGMSLAALVGIALNLLLPDETDDIVAHAEGVVTSSGADEKDDNENKVEKNDEEIEKNEIEEESKDASDGSNNSDYDDLQKIHAENVAKVKEEIEEEYDEEYEEEENEEYVEVENENGDEVINVENIDDEDNDIDDDNKNDV